MRLARRLCVSLGNWGSSPSLTPPSYPFSTHAFGFRGNITRKWWLACECRYHFLAWYQPALPVITAPPGLRHGLLDKPPTAKVYCVFHVPSPSIRLSFSCHVSYSVLFYRALLRRFSILNCLSRSISIRLYHSLPLSLSLWRYTIPCGKCPFPPCPIPATSDTLRCIELFENRPKRREITWENGYVVRCLDR